MNEPVLDNLIKTSYYELLYPAGVLKSTLVVILGGGKIEDRRVEKGLQSGASS